MSFHLFCISLYKNATGAGWLQLSHLSCRPDDQKVEVIWHDMTKRSAIQRQTQWRTRRGLACISLCAIVQLGRVVVVVQLAPITLPAPPSSHIGDDRRRRQGGASSFELWARGSLSSGPEALSSEVLRRQGWTNYFELSQILRPWGERQTWLVRLKRSKKYAQFYAFRYHRDAKTGTDAQGEPKTSSSLRFCWGCEVRGKRSYK